MDQPISTSVREKAEIRFDWPIYLGIAKFFSATQFHRCNRASILREDQ